MQHRVLPTADCCSPCAGDASTRAAASTSFTLPAPTKQYPRQRTTSRHTSSNLHKNNNKINQHADKLLLTPKWFLVCWWTVFALHAGEIAFLVAMARLYYWLLHDELASYFLLGNLTLEFTHATLDALNWGFVVAAVLHGMALVRLLYRSFKARQFVFKQSLGSCSPAASSVSSKTKSDTTASLTPTSSLFVHLNPQQPQLHHPRQIPPQSNPKQTYLAQCCTLLCPLCLVRGGQYMHQRCVEPWLSIRSKHYDDFVLVHEWLEVAFQVYQANQMSIFIATRWINHVVIGMIVINCVSTPLIHGLVPSSRIAKRRLLEITMSALLNFVNSTVIPLTIFSKYVAAYDPQTHFFRYDLVFNDSWYQQLFVTSLVDYVTTLLPHLSLLSCLLMGESMVLRKDQPIPGHSVQPSIKLTDQVTTGGLLPKSPIETGTASGSQTRRQQGDQCMTSMATSRLASRLVSMLRFGCFHLLWLSGFLVFGVHINSQRIAQVPGCVLPSTPWINRGKSSCAVMNINCYRRDIQGSQQEIQDILQHFNGDTVVVLILSHCPGLEIPPMVRQLSKLNGIDIYNCTLRDWPRASSVRQQDLPLLEYVYFIRSNVSYGEIPPGLLFPEGDPEDQEKPNDAGDFPPSVEEIFFFESNLSSLSPEIVGKWQGVRAFGLEFCQLKQFPPVLCEMSLEYIYLTGNPLTQLSSESPMDADACVWASCDRQDTPLGSLDLSGTLLEVLPSHTKAQLAFLDTLHLEHTQLRHVPKYLQDWYLSSAQNGKHVSHSLFGSTFCSKNLSDNSNGNSSSSCSSGSEEEEEYRKQVCQQDQNTRLGAFPIDIVARQRLP